MVVSPTFSCLSWAFHFSCTHTFTFHILAQTSNSLFNRSTWKYLTWGDPKVHLIMFKGDKSSKLHVVCICLKLKLESLRWCWSRGSIEWIGLKSRAGGICSLLSGCQCTRPLVHRLKGIICKHLHWGGVGGLWSIFSSLEYSISASSHLRTHGINFDLNS